MNCSLVIRTGYDQLGAQEKKIADYVLSHPNEAVYETIDVLAAHAGASVATVVRFSRRLGYSGFQQFRLALVRENTLEKERLYEATVTQDNDPVSQIFNLGIQTLYETEKRLDRTAIKTAVDILLKARRICLMGLGGSNIIAYSAFHMFMRLGLNCHFSLDFHMQLITASQLNEQDAVLLISHTGINTDTIDLKEEIKKHGAKIICLNNSEHSPVTLGSDVSLPVHTMRGLVTESLSASIGYRTIINTLYYFIAEALGKEGELHLESMRDSMARRAL